MSRLLAVVALLLATAGCAGPALVAGHARPAPVPVTTPAASTTAAAPPPEATPARDGRCPYLENSFVAETNGQKVGRVRVSADQPPACFFYRSDGGEQLRVQILTGADPAVARAMVDRAAPVSTSDPAALDGGWEGGKQPTDTGAVFAVAKGDTAVVVVTNQQQTIKASRVAEQAIAALGL